MLNKTFSGGLTVRGASATIDYLLDNRVEQEQAYILEGNVQLTKQVIADCTNQNKWSSGVMTFSEVLPRETLEAIKDEWKATFLCGMADEQTAPLFVVHTDKDRSEIHYVMPRTELSTGKAFNPYFVKRDFKKKDLFQEYINIKYNLTAHTDEGRQAPTSQNKKQWAKDKKSVLKQIDEQVIEAINKGTINSREGVIAYLRENDFEVAANAENLKYIPIVNPNNPDKNWRLKGAIYSKDFNYSSLQNDTQITPLPPEQQTRRELSTVKKELDYIISKNTTYNKERYKYVRTENSITADRGRERTAEPRERISRAKLRKLVSQTNRIIRSHNKAERANPNRIAERRRGRRVKRGVRRISEVINSIDSSFKLENNRSRNEAVFKVAQAIEAKKKRIKESERKKQVKEVKTPVISSTLQQTDEKRLDASGRPILESSSDMYDNGIDNSNDQSQGHGHSL